MTLVREPDRLTRTDRPRPRRGIAPALALVSAWLVLAAIIHINQGTAELDLGALWQGIAAGELPQATAILLESRLPRLFAAVLVGAALALSGAAMQSVARNPLASPDTTGVAAGAYLALTVVSALGVSLGTFGGMAVAALGGLAAAAAVIGFSARGSLSPARLILAGSVLSLGLGSAASAILLLFPWETQGLYAWGSGSLSQNGSAGVLAASPVVILAAVGLLLMGRRLDLLQLGDDSAAALGVPVAATRRNTVLLAVLLTAASVTVAGPIGFVGLCAPALVRLLSHRFTALRKQRPFILLSALCGIALVLTADVLVRGIFGASAGVSIPTGVVTSLIGAAFLVVLARRLVGGNAGGDSIITMRAGTRIGRKYPHVIILGAAVVLLAATIVGILLGDSTVLLGDVWNWLRGAAAPRLEIILDSRVPRVFAAILAGAAFALAGLLVQSVTRNPLAEPGILGVSASAGLGAVFVLTVSSAASDLMVFLAAMAMSAVAAIVLAFSARNQLQFILSGIGLGTAASAITTLIIVASDPYNQTKALTWLGGSTYGATPTSLVPVVLMLIVAGLVTARWHRDLDLLQFDEVTPHVLGVDVPRSRLLFIAVAVGLTAAATSSIGVISFVGLVAPHTARLLLGKRHRFVAPLAVLLGAILVLVSDIVGRAAIAPSQLPAGMVVALVGTPYFLVLLRRMRSLD